MRARDPAPSGHVVAGARTRSGVLAAGGPTLLRLDPLALALLAPALAVGAAALVLAVADVDAYARLIAEDGPVEYASSLLWFASAVASLASLVIHLGSAQLRLFAP